MTQPDPHETFDQTLDEDTVDAEAVNDDDTTTPCLTVLQGKERGKRTQLQAGEATLGRSPEATIQIKDDRISRVHCRLTYDDDAFWIEDCESRNGTHVNGQQVLERTRLEPGALIRIGHTLLRLSLRHKVEMALEEEMFQAATTDPLTGVPNRRWFEEQGDACVMRARRHGHPLSLLMLDVDHFKRINDTYGHPFGDSVLATLAELVIGSKRHEDLLCRYGGEEFLLMLVESDLSGACILAERLRTRVGKHPFKKGDEVLSVTVSIGVASFRPEDTLNTIVGRADKALYRAKEKGRNRVEAQDPVDA